MTYDCPITSCSYASEASREVAFHVRYDHQLRFPTDATAEFADLGIQAPPGPIHASWNQGMPKLRPRVLP